MLAFLLVLGLMAPRVVDVKLGAVHREIMRDTTRFLDVEGALRSAKTWTCLFKERRKLEEHPGIASFIARYKDNDLHQKLIPDYRRICEHMQLPYGEWNSREQCFDLANKSKLYAIHLKSGQDSNRYASVRGLTVARGYIDQLEEVPEDVYGETALRISQPGYPQQLTVSPNPVPDSHWIAKRWPVVQADSDHRYISLSIWDNKHNLAPETIAAAEQLYPLGHPLRRVKLEGRRGLDVRGKPVYLGAFVRSRHASRPVDLIPELPLCEAYDYGFHHPCVVWYQWAPWGWLRVLGGVMGSDLHLDAFLPIVERYRKEWFPERLRIEACCDPAGAANNSQGLRGTPVAMLQEWYRQNGERDERGQYVTPAYKSDANHPERRHAANQVAATYMRRTVSGEEAFQVDPERWMLVELQDERQDSWFVDGLEAGYVLEDDARHSSTLGSYFVPKKDGWFEHGQNCFEYGIQATVYGLPQKEDRATLQQTEIKAKHAREVERMASKALRASQKDVDAHEVKRAIVRSYRGGRSYGNRRGGY